MTRNFWGTSGKPVPALWLAAAVAISMLTVCQVQADPPPAATQEAAKEPQPKTLAERMWDESWAESNDLYRAAIDSWADRFHELNDQDKLKEFIESCTGLETAVNMAGDFLNGTSTDRVRQNFRRCVMDPSELSQEMREYFHEFVSELHEQDLRLLTQVGFDRKTIEARIPRFAYPDRDYTRGYSQVVETCRGFLGERAMRFGASVVAADVASNTAMDAARDSGAYVPKEGSFPEYASRAAADFLIGMLIDAVADPMPTWICQLHTDMTDAEIQALYSDDGFLKDLLAAANQHVKLRNELYIEALQQGQAPARKD